VCFVVADMFVAAAREHWWFGSALVFFVAVVVICSHVCGHSGCGWVHVSRLELVVSTCRLVNMGMCFEVVYIFYFLTLLVIACVWRVCMCLFVLLCLLACDLTHLSIDQQDK
jgi:hypothetical protein